MQEIDRISNILDKYEFLFKQTNSFFIENTFHSLPLALRELSKLPLKDILNFNFTVKELEQDCQLPNLSSETMREYQRIQNFITVGMSPKKRMEVSQMAGVINEYAREHNIHHIVDIGAGQGYLGQTLAYFYDYNVICVDGSQVQTKGAIEHQRLILKANIAKKSNGTLSHINSRIDKENSFNAIIDNRHDWLVCGLHTCGDLASTTIQEFIKSKAKVLVNVGCCYNQLIDGFPLSNYAKQKNIKLCFNKKMTANQSVSRWNLDEKAFRHHHWRCMLEVLINENVDDRKARVGRLGRKAFNSDFKQYCACAFEKLQIPFPTDNLGYRQVEDVEQRFENRFVEIVVYFSLKGLISPLIERLILLDRQQYLMEHGIGAKLIPVFTKVESPRNVALIAVKTKVC